MKSVLFSLLILAAGSAHAAECVDANGTDVYNQPEVFTQAIEQAPSCAAAKELAEACAYGSSLDVMTAGAAYGVCDKELQALNPKVSINNTLNQMTEMCGTIYEDKEGTMYRSAAAYCGLNAIEWVLNTYKNSVEEQ